ncbi:hypothetical protein [Streptomyces coerulescens]|uniref:Uncharacterized protein n=1 Tax=Streptomyces coerulescens TaxID=29304 RepID=A0ABW0D0J7_STRCD
MRRSPSRTPSLTFSVADRPSAACSTHGPSRLFGVVTTVLLPVFATVLAVEPLAVWLRRVVR